MLPRYSMVYVLYWFKLDYDTYIKDLLILWYLANLDVDFKKDISWIMLLNNYYIAYVHTWIEARLRFHVIFKGNVPFYDSQIQNVNIESKLELLGNDKFD